MTVDFEAAKLAVVAFTGLAKDALHVHVGVGVLIGYALFSGQPLRTGRPLLAAVLVAAAGEILDLWAKGVSCATLQASWHDLGNTLFWPVLLTLMAHFRRSPVR